MSKGKPKEYLMVDPKGKTIQVIKKSAVDKLERDLEIMMHENTELRLKVDALAEALEYARREFHQLGRAELRGTTCEQAPKEYRGEDE